jgi:hypothetical protein
MLPSDERLHNYGTSPYFMGKFAKSVVIFHSYVKLPEVKSMLKTKRFFIVSVYIMPP